ncbi:MAG: ATP-dependent DNA helicase RecG [Microgenomates group bacterium GW2011_GWF2_45_18]|nr:MAG: ATP-dependent DNA helicase RecG [Microgenomates group bacterium GW2011_GWF2_45_18]HAU98945.1 DNA helicase RecG [Candidatus Paceibacterota bacterium]HAX01098.1 DNA helicase RecG [Candidatus Paceibacterota bacterium]
MTNSGLLSFSSSIQDVPGVGEKTANTLEKLEIISVQDLLYHIPFRYEDFREQKAIGAVEVGDKVTVRAQVRSITKFSAKTRHIEIIRAVLEDSSGKIEATWFNQAYLLMQLRKGSEAFFSGMVEEFHGKKSLNNPAIEKIEHEGVEQLHSGRLVPIYPETQGITSRMLRKMIATTFPNIKIVDSFSDQFLHEHHLHSLADSLKYLHFPDSLDDVFRYHKRLAFEEVFALLQQSQAEKHKRLSMRATPLKMTVQQRQQFTNALPFSLTPTQTQTIMDCVMDLSQTYPAQRLIQGDVGAGKTVVAGFTLYTSAINQQKAFLIAPTQILAQQHDNFLTKIFSLLGIKTQLVIAQTQINLDAQIYIGTHALLSQIEALHPAVVVVDEEHRFGVEQRNAFEKSKLKTKPHVFTMTATPIPRTVALTSLSHLDISTLDMIESKKRKVLTKLVSENKRKKAYEWIDQKLAENQQLIVVCPFIYESTQLDRIEVKSAEKTFTEISKAFPDRKTALIHGKVAQDERTKILQEMHNKKIQILVATSMIEVGIDLPDASIMIIEGAERFGLAQLHQLRGRVGRAGQQAYCFLFTTTPELQSDRLQKFCEITDGNELAELDLRSRGSGEIVGTRQHGWSGMRFASFFDTSLIEECKNALTS